MLQLCQQLLVGHVLRVFPVFQVVHVDLRVLEAQRVPGDQAHHVVPEVQVHHVVRVVPIVLEVLRVQLVQVLLFVRLLLWVLVNRRVLLVPKVQKVRSVRLVLPDHVVRQVRRDQSLLSDRALLSALDHHGVRGFQLVPEVR